MRIPIPENKDQFIVLAKKVLAKHTELGADSPLNGIDGIASFGAQVTAADTSNQQSKDLYEQAAAATEACNRAIGPDAMTAGGVHYFLVAARDVLSGQNKGKEHLLGDWGYNIIAAPVPNPAAKEAAKAARAAAKAVRQKAAAA